MTNQEIYKYPGEDILDQTGKVQSNANQLVGAYWNLFFKQAGIYKKEELILFICQNGSLAWV